MSCCLLLHERDELAERLWGPGANNTDRSNRHVRLTLALCSDPALVALAALKPAESRIVEDARRLSLAVGARWSRLETERPGAT